MRDIFAGIDGVEQAYIYGSWAARAEGAPGKVSQDVDVLLVGRADADAVFEAAAAASTILGFEVNARSVRPERWVDPGDDQFVRQVKGSPLVLARFDRAAVSA